MSRPESIADIEIAKVEFAHVDLNKIAANGALMKAYAAFLDAVSKSDQVEIDPDNYRGVTFRRVPSLKEQTDQLSTAQARWDEHQKYYEQWADGQELSAEYKYTYAKNHAQAEDLPMFPWEKAGKPETSPDIVQSVVDKVNELETAGEL